MTENDRFQFEMAWLQAAETYGPNATPTEGAISLAFEALRGFELSDVMTALTAHLINPDEGRFAPKIADIVRHIKGDNSSAAQLAWTKLIKAIQEIGPYESVVFDDEKIMEVVDKMGGWIFLNAMSDKEKPFKQNEFVTRYKGYLNNPPPSHPKKLIGLSEAENKRNNHRLEPLLVGEPLKCLEVYKTGGSDKPKAIRLSDIIGEIESKALKTQQTLKIVKEVNK